MKILVLNAGSSSLKYKLFKNDRHLCGGVVERIGEEGGAADHAAALSVVQEALRKSGALSSFEALDGIGHRVVHGGERFVAPVVIDREVMAAIRALIPLAPLHNPVNLKGIETVSSLAPDVPQVAVFDTAFHQTMREEAYLYALPYEMYESHGIRRYGFHGTSHAYVAEEAARILAKPPEKTKLITLHLGNGASACAVKGGRSIDTSMGLTPLAGLVMGTRCGDIDPEIVVRLQKEGYDVDDILNKKSGLKGLCGENDMRMILKRARSNEPAAKRALAAYIHRIRHYLGAYLLQLGGADAVVFTGGVGEHAAEVRKMVCEGLEWFGILLDEAANESGAVDISAPSSKVRLLVIPTDEELAIAREVRRLLRT